MKVILINVPYTSKSYKPFKLPPFGLGFIAAYLHKNKFDYNLLDLGYNTLSESKNLLNKYLTNKYFALSFFQENLNNAIQIIRYIKAKNKNAKIIVGGIFATIEHENLLKEFKEIDYIIRGDGERAIISILDNKYSTNEGISYRLGKDLFISNKINRIKNLGEIPAPIFNNEIIKDYNLMLKESEVKTNLIPIVWSRGCNYNCAFCSIKNSNNFWRARPSYSVIEEVTGKYAPNKRNHIIFFDANPLQHPNDFLAIIEELNKRFKITFSYAARVDQILKHKGVMQKLHKLGCLYVEVGIESFNNKTLKYYSKNITKDMIVKALDFLKRNNIKLELDFILYNAFTTKKEILENLYYLERYGYRENTPLEALFSYTRLYSGTKIREIFEKSNGKLDYKSLPPAKKIIKDNKVKKIYSNLKKLRKEMPLLYKFSVISEKLSKTSQNDKNTEEFILLAMLLKIIFFDWYRETIKENKKKIANLSKKYRLIIKKLNAHPMKNV